jgi:hypothetical protein
MHDRGIERAPSVSLQVMQKLKPFGVVLTLGNSMIGRTSKIYRAPQLLPPNLQLCNYTTPLHFAQIPFENPPG